MADTTPSPRFTLRQLPLPAKLVITCFLLAVGLGYTSAMVQLHMQHSDRDGTHLPTVKNVIAVFAGKKRPTEKQDDDCCKLEAIIRGSRDGDLTSKNMAPAFFAEDGADFNEKADKNPALLPKLIEEREGERKAIIAWIRGAAETRKTAYEQDQFTLPKDLIGKPITPAYKSGGDTVRVTSILRDRCVRCHRPGGEKADVPLTTLEELAVLMPRETSEDPYGWVDSGKQMSLEKLTQSTHAHLLSFAVLFGLTGFIFAFTSYPGIIRGVIGPIVLIAQVADVSCWWLARLPSPYGPNFAMAIIGTGGIVGMGRMAQIVLGLFNMYGCKGKVVLLLLFALAGGLGFVAKVKVVDPFIEQEGKRSQSVEPASTAKPGPATPVVAANGTPKFVATGTRFEKVLDGSFVAKGPWGKVKAGMIPAFFEKDGENFRDVIKNGEEAEKAKLIEERKGEHAVVVAWMKLDDAPRKAAYEGDKFPLPAELAGKPLTEVYKADADAKIKTLLNDRCVRCHGPGSDQEDIPLDTYEGILKQFTPPEAK